MICVLLMLSSTLLVFFADFHHKQNFNLYLAVGVVQSLIWIAYVTFASHPGRCFLSRRSSNGYRFAENMSTRRFCGCPWPSFLKSLIFHLYGIGWMAMRCGMGLRSPSFLFGIVLFSRISILKSNDSHRSVKTWTPCCLSVVISTSSFP